MKLLRIVLSLTLCVALVGAAASGSNTDVNMVKADREDRVRTALTLIGAAAGLGSGMFGSISFLSYSPHTLSLADMLYVAVPSTLAFTVTSTLASRWLANRSLSLKPSLPLSPLVGAGLGAAACAFVGAVSFPILGALGTSARIGVSSGVEGLAMVGMGVLAGAFWGAVTGVPLGAVTVPLVSLYMGF
jgi:predicted acyltransferase